MKNFSDSRFIRLLHQPPSVAVSLLEIETAFEEFTQKVYEDCLSGIDRTQLFFSIQHSRSVLIALQKIKHQTNEKAVVVNSAYISSGISFLDAALMWIKDILSNNKANTPAINTKGRIPVWTGNKIDLAEFIYGADSLKNFNNGDITLKEVADYFGKMLGIEIKDVSGCYVDMRERTSNSRTTYLERMSEALNKRMERDDEKLTKIRR